MLNRNWNQSSFLLILKSIFVIRSTAITEGYYCKCGKCEGRDSQHLLRVVCKVDESTGAWRHNDDKLNGHGLFGQPPSFMTVTRMVLGSASNVIECYYLLLTGFRLPINIVTQPSYTHTHTIPLHSVFSLSDRSNVESDRIIILLEKELVNKKNNCFLFHQHRRPRALCSNRFVVVSSERSCNACCILSIWLDFGPRKLTKILLYIIL